MDYKGNTKVAIVTGTLSMGGAELIILNLGQSLRQLGYDVTIVTTSRPGNWFEQIEKNGLRALHIDGRFQVHPYRHAWRVGQRLREENFDVVLLTKFTNSERSSQAALNMLPDHVIAIPWIHSDTESTYRTALANREAWNVAVGVGVRVAATAAKKSKGKQVLHIPNGLVLPPAELLKRGRTADARPFRLCYLGRIEQVSKGIFNIPKILESCSQKQFDVVLDIVGNGPDREELVQRFEQAGLMDRVVFHGAIPHDEVFQFLCRAHVALMPSYYEAMPCVPIEAQFCGCVPIVSKLPGVTDTIIDDGRTGILVDVDDINGFVEAIGGLVNDSARWQAMSEAGQRRALTEFTVDAMGQSFDQLIQACLRGEYPLQHPRRAWLPVDPLALTWREAIPRSIHRLGIGNRVRRCLEKIRLSPCSRRNSNDKGDNFFFTQH
jgi:glycosyltransferase involved in cell wall biosynthesis